MNFSILFFIGIIEEFIAILYYKMGQKNFKYACGIVQIIRVYLWAYVITLLFKNLQNSFHIITWYAIGGAVGDWLSLTFEPYLSKNILLIHKFFKKTTIKNRKKWWLYQFGNKRK